MRASTRQLLWGALFAAIILGGIDARVVRLLLDPRAAQPPPDRESPAYPRFLEEVAARTKPGETIVLVAPEYEYPFYRASYLLPDRRIVPLLDSDGRAHAERLREASVVAVWRMSAPDGFDTVWRNDEGMLLRRKR